jgi:hypothetical protein
MREKINSFRILVGKLLESSLLECQHRNKRTVLKLISKKQVLVMWIGLNYIK